MSRSHKYNLSQPAEYILGTWCFSKADWGEFAGDSVEILEKLLVHAQERNIRWIDTAPVYGQGEVETILGCLKISKKFFLATKFGLLWPEIYHHRKLKINADPELARLSCEKSLQRLQREHIELFQLHFPPRPMLPGTSWWDDLQMVLEKLKEQGKIGAVGLCNPLPELPKKLFSKDSPVDVFQVEMNLLQRWAEKKIEPLLENFPGKVWLYSPLARGLLGGNYPPGKIAFAEGDHRAEIKQFGEKSRVQIAACWQRIEELQKKYTVSPAALALAWLRQHRPEAGIILGAKNEQQLDDLLGTLPDLDREDAEKLGWAFEI